MAGNDFQRFVQYANGANSLNSQFFFQNDLCRDILIDEMISCSFGARRCPQNFMSKGDNFHSVSILYQALKND
jgi:hypothetical protein